MIYPHRRHLIGKNTCDACKDIGRNFLRVNGQNFKGLWICESNPCKKIVLEWLDKATISNSSLVEELGKNIYVYRSNGRKESGWQIEGDAYQDEYNGPFWVSVKDKYRRSKCITLSTLRSWN